MQKARQGSVSSGRPSTLMDIARVLGLSAMTVSRALNGHPAVKDETRRQVMQKAAELNYQPNLWARSLVTNRSHLVGLVIPDISHAFYAEVTLGIQQAIEEKGYSLLLCNSGRDPKAELREIEALVAARMDGLIVASTQPEEAWGYFARLKEKGLQFVLIDRFFQKLNCSRLTADDLEVGRIATEHLICLGHMRIAHVCGPAISPGRLRKEGYLRALQSHALTVNPSWIVPGNFRMEDSYQAARFLLQLPDQPTAIFAGSDYGAFGAIQACRDAGYEVPRDISVIGAGNIEGDRHPNPFLSTVDWDRHELGREAARVLVGMIVSSGQARPMKRMFAPMLLVRQSTAPPGGGCQGKVESSAFQQSRMFRF